MIRKLKQRACSVIGMWALASVGAGCLTWSPVAQASLVTVTGLFDRYTGPGSTAGNVNGLALPDAVVTTLGISPNAQVDFSGFVPPNQLKFTPAAPQEVSAKGVEFLLGFISYTNGNWYPGTSQFHIRFTTASSNPAFNGQVFDDSLTLVVTPNVIAQAPLLNADFVYFTGYAGLGSIRVFEEFDSPGNSTGSVSFYGKIGSLIPTRFADATGGATIVASIDPNAVSEPSAIMLVASALGALALRGRQRRVRDRS